MHRLAPALVLLALLGGAVRAEAAERGVPRGWLGVTVDQDVDAHDAPEWRRMASAGVETVRAAFYWARLQPRPPAGHGAAMHFRSTDAIVVAAARHGMSVLPVVQWPPDWAAVQPGVFGSPPSSPAAVERLFGALVARYGPRGSLWRERPGLPRRPIRAWQVFNEPNIVGFWSVQPYPDDYVATLRAAARGIRAADPAATVVLAGLTNTSWTALESLYAAGAQGSFDAVAIHPYTRRPADVLRIVSLVRDVMLRHGDAGLPIWVTEFTWSAIAGRLAEPPAWAAIWAGVTDSVQARLLRQVMRGFAAARTRLRIGRVFWYTWLSRGSDTGVFAWAGLRRTHGRARRDAPALRAYRSWARRLEGCAKRRGDARRCR